MLFTLIAYPLFNGILEIILMWFETIKSKMEITITKSALEAKQLAYDFELKCAQDQMAENKTYAIGFTADIPTEEEIEFEDE